MYIHILYMHYTIWYTFIHILYTYTRYMIYNEHMYTYIYYTYTIQYTMYTYYIYLSYKQYTIGIWYTYIHILAAVTRLRPAFRGIVVANLLPKRELLNVHCWWWQIFKNIFRGFFISYFAFIKKLCLFVSL